MFGKLSCLPNLVTRIQTHVCLTLVTIQNPTCEYLKTICSSISPDSQHCCPLRALHNKLTHS